MENNYRFFGTPRVKARDNAMKVDVDKTASYALTVANDLHETLFRLAGYTDNTYTDGSARKSGVAWIKKHIRQIDVLIRSLNTLSRQDGRAREAAYKGLPILTSVKKQLSKAIRLVERGDFEALMPIARRIRGPFRELTSTLVMVNRGKSAKAGDIYSDPQFNQLKSLIKRQLQEIGQASTPTDFVKISLELNRYQTTPAKLARKYPNHAAWLSQLARLLVGVGGEIGGMGKALRYREDQGTLTRPVITDARASAARMVNNIMKRYRLKSAKAAAKAIPPSWL